MYQLYGKYYQTLSIMTGNDVLCVGMWNTDLILKYHNFYIILCLFPLSIYTIYHWSYIFLLIFQPNLCLVFTEGLYFTLRG